MPDICIVYLLHLECGQLINLFDWLCAFVAVVDPEAAEKLTSHNKQRGSKDDIDPTLQYPSIVNITLSVAKGHRKLSYYVVELHNRLWWWQLQ